MPTISMFYGIAIRMYYDDHAPPHFHTYYGDQAAIVRIDTLEMSEGSLPRRALSMVLEWAQVHRAELVENWEAARQHEPLKPIAPLR